MQQQPQRCLQTLPLRQLLRRRQQDRAAAVMAAAAAVVAAAWWAHLRLCYQRWQNQQHHGQQRGRSHTLGVSAAAYSRAVWAGLKFLPNTCRPT